MAGSADGFWGLLSSPAGQGLLAAGLGALGGRTALGGISRGGLLGLNVYNQAKQGALDEQRMQKQDQLFDMQMQQRQQAQEQALARQNYLASVGQVTSPKVGAQPNAFSPMRWVGMGGSVEEAKALAGAGNWGKTAIKDYKEVRLPDGKVQIVGFDEFGNQLATGAAPYKAPEFRDLGGKQVAIDPVTMQPVWTGAKTLTPGERASNAVAWANHNLSQKRFNFDREQRPEYRDGNWVVPPRGMQPGQAAPAGTSSGIPANVTEGERNAFGYATRMDHSTTLLDKFAKTGTPTYATHSAGSIPLVGVALQRELMSADQQRYRQAQEDWVRAKLRKESGAVIGAEEMEEEIRTYFPQPWDKPENVEQKRQAREVANQAMRAAAGRAYRPMTRGGGGGGGAVAVPPASDDPLGLRR